MNAINLTLKKLTKAKNKGVMVMDFPEGFRLSARIKDLRDMGYTINTDKVQDYSNGYERTIARYTLIKR